MAFRFPPGPVAGGASELDGVLVPLTEAAGTAESEGLSDGVGSTTRAAGVAGDEDCFAGESTDGRATCGNLTRWSGDSLSTTVRDLAVLGVDILVFWRWQRRSRRCCGDDGGRGRGGESGCGGVEWAVKGFYSVSFACLSQAALPCGWVSSDKRRGRDLVAGVARGCGHDGDRRRGRGSSAAVKGAAEAAGEQEGWGGPCGASVAGSYCAALASIA